MWGERCGIDLVMVCPVGDGVCRCAAAGAGRSWRGIGLCAHDLICDGGREWDDDNSGSVARDEFAKALPMLGLEASVEQINAIFDEWDRDKSGTLEIRELNSLLRRRVELDPSLLPGAAGEIELKTDQKYAVRKRKLDKDDSVLLQGLDLEEEGKPIAEQVCQRV